MKRKILFCSIALVTTMMGGLIGQAPALLAYEDTSVAPTISAAQGTLTATDVFAPEQVSAQAAAPATVQAVAQTNTVQAVFATAPATQSVADPTSEKKATFEDFVERLYVVALNRPSEKEGKKFWITKVSNGVYNGADCARFFLLEAPEFMQRNLSVEDFVETLYKTFFDRGSDPAGRQTWVNAIWSGRKSRAAVVNDFIESTEWCNVCASYSVKSGAKWHKATKASPKTIEFVTRLYKYCLNREPEEGGLAYWALALTNLEQTGCSAAKQFFESKEFDGMTKSDGEYTRRLYHTFLNRTPSNEEWRYWIRQLLYMKTTRRKALAFFGNSEEFRKICASYGIEQGSM